MRGFDRKGQACAENTAHSRCDGGSLMTRLIAHIGPMMNALYCPSGSPHVQQRFSRIARPIFGVSMTRKSGVPLIQATNHGTGNPR